ncbi:hypothetical protein ACMHYB_59175 [Sorangium sp. So ce1128]
MAVGRALLVDPEWALEARKGEPFKPLGLEHIHQLYWLVSILDLPARRRTPSSTADRRRLHDGSGRGAGNARISTETGARPA